MPKMNVMDAVVRMMESEGVDVAFGVPGAAILPLYKALAKSEIRHVSVRPPTRAMRWRRCSRSRAT
jgi:tartronate-semialdehyde synthase